MSNQQADMRQHEHEMREAFEAKRDSFNLNVRTKAFIAQDFFEAGYQAATLAAEETFNQRLVELTSRIRELEADANRYRYLRDVDVFILDKYDQREWDEAIDAAATPALGRLH